MKKILLVVIVGLFCLFTAAKAQAQWVCTGNIFNDVNSPPMSLEFCDNIERFSALGITKGCAADDPGTPGNEAMYCSDATLTRSQMAVFFMRAMDNLIQKRVTESCPAGEFIFQINADGTVECGTLDVIISDSRFVNEGQSNSITAGMIVDGTVGASDVNPAEVQLRVSASCNTGSSIRMINQDGTVVCETNDNSGGTVTQINTGAGLSGGPITTTGTISASFAGTGSATTVARSDHTHDASGDVPSGYFILGATSTAPGGYTYLGATIESSGYWKTKTAMPMARAGLAVAVANSRIYAVGGYDGATYLVTNEEYDPATDSWATRRDMSVGRQSAVAASVSNVVYVFGGYNAALGALSSVEAYTPSTNLWATRAPMPTVKYLGAAAVVGSTIYVFGGYDGANYTGSNYGYNTSANSWSAARASMPTARRALAAAVVDGFIYAIGGYNGAYLANNEVYDPVTNIWADAAPMARARAGLAASVLNNKIYAMGGSAITGGIIAYGGLLSTVEEYDPSTDLWVPKASMGVRRSGLGAATLAGKIYAIGGNTWIPFPSPGRIGYTTITEEYDAGIFYVHRKN